MGTRAVLSFLSGLAVTLLLASVPPILADDEAPSRLTGCLNVNALDGGFVLTDESSGEEIRIQGIPDLGEYADNQRVTVVGAWSQGEDEEEVFEVVEIERLGECE